MEWSRERVLQHDPARNSPGFIDSPGKGIRSDVDEIQDNQNAQKQSYTDKRECTLHRKSVDRFYREVS